MHRFSFLGVFLVVTGCGGDTGAGDGISGKGTGGSSTAAGGASSAGAAATGGGSGALDAGGASSSGCKDSRECAVPAICKQCSNGTSSCATAACVGGECRTTFPPCEGNTGGATGAGGTPGSGGTSGNLKWYATCGPPVCRAPSGSGGTSSGAPPCTTSETVGASCATAGTECDSGGACVGPLTCASTDPRHGGQCPVSRAKYKTDIEYLSANERAKLADDVQSIPLVRYRYKDGPEREHLGFIIEDVEPSPGIDSQHDQVDLYGYTSMAVAALQEQHREIDELKHEIAELRAELRLKAKHSRKGVN